MKTLSSIIDQEIKNHIDSIEVCNDLIVSSSENPNLYDGIVALAEGIVEDLIKTNFKYLISLAVDNYEGEYEFEDAPEDIEIREGVSEEDDEMLRFISS